MTFRLVIVEANYNCTMLNMLKINSFVKIKTQNSQFNTHIQCSKNPQWKTIFHFGTQNSFISIQLYQQKCNFQFYLVARNQLDLIDSESNPYKLKQKYLKLYDQKNFIIAQLLIHIQYEDGKEYIGNQKCFGDYLNNVPFHKMTNMFISKCHNNIQITHNIQGSEQYHTDKRKKNKGMKSEEQEGAFIKQSKNENSSFSLFKCLDNTDTELESIIIIKKQKAINKRF